MRNKIMKNVCFRICSQFYVGDHVNIAQFNLACVLHVAHRVRRTVNGVTGLHRQRRTAFSAGWKTPHKHGLFAFPQRFSTAISTLVNSRALVGCIAHVEVLNRDDVRRDLIAKSRFEIVAPRFTSTPRSVTPGAGVTSATNNLGYNKGPHYRF